MALIECPECKSQISLSASFYLMPWHLTQRLLNYLGSKNIFFFGVSIFLCIPLHSVSKKQLSNGYQGLEWGSTMKDARKKFSSYKLESVAVYEDQPSECNMDHLRSVIFRTYPHGSLETLSDTGRYSYSDFDLPTCRAMTFSSSTAHSFTLLFDSDKFFAVEIEVSPYIANDVFQQIVEKYGNFSGRNWWPETIFPTKGVNGNIFYWKRDETQISQFIYLGEDGQMKNPFDLPVVFPGFASRISMERLGFYRSQYKKKN